MAGKNLIVYYSRTGLSERLAKALQEKLGGDIDRITYADRDKVSFAAAGLEAIRKTTAAFKGDVHDAGQYDQIFFISPVWASALATPIRSYMAANKGKIKTYALLVTCGGSGLEGANKDAQAAIGKAAENAEQFRSKEIQQGSFDLKGFIQQIGGLYDVKSNKAGGGTQEGDC